MFKKSFLSIDDLIYLFCEINVKSLLIINKRYDLVCEVINKMVD